MPLKEAHALFEETLQLYPEHKGGWQLLGTLYEVTNNCEAAVYCYNRAWGLTRR